MKWSVIQSVEGINNTREDKNVYCIELKKHHNFALNGIVVRKLLSFT